MIVLPLSSLLHRDTKSSNHLQARTASDNNPS